MHTSSDKLGRWHTRRHEHGNERKRSKKEKESLLIVTQNAIKTNHIKTKILTLNKIANVCYVETEIKWPIK